LLTEGILVVSRQNADIADTLQLKEIAKTTKLFLASDGL